MHSLRRKASSNYIAIGMGLDFSELALNKTVLLTLAWLYLFLMASPLLAEDCPPAFYPSSVSSALHIAADDVESLLALRNQASSCTGVAADLAQLYFWGAGGQAVDMGLAQRYFLMAGTSPIIHGNLRALQPAMVLLGLDTGFSQREAVRRLQREIRSGDPLRRDKALAVINHIAHSLPVVNFLTGSLYLDRDLRRPAKALRPPALLLTSNSPSARLLLSGDDGSPQLFWAQADRVIDSGVEFNGFFSTSLHANHDLRQQLWPRPGAQLRVVKLFTVFSPTSGESYESQCSATLISNEWLLTAAHCFYSASGDPLAMVTAVSIEGADASSAMREAVAEVWVHAGHDEADDGRGELFGYSGSDIAMLRLAKGVSLAPAPSLSSLLPRASAQVRSIGFPRDKPGGGLWSSRCHSELLDSGRGARAAVYSFDCVSAPGQSGAAIYDGWSGRGDIVGVLSANARAVQISTGVYAAFTPGIIAAIKSLLSEGKSGDGLFRRLAFTDMAFTELNKLP